MKNQYLSEVQAARGLAILGVLTVHGTSTALMNVPHESIYYPIYSFLNTMGKLGTPTFIMLSSFILFYSYFRKDLSFEWMIRFFTKRFKFIVVPYVIISLFYFFTKWKVYGNLSFETNGQAWDKLQYYLLLGKAHPHLYFIFLSIQFYVLFPLMLWTMKRFAIIRKYAIPIGITIQLSWLYLNTTYNWLSSEIYSIIFAYAAFYFLGAYIGIHYEQLKEKFLNVPAAKTKILITSSFLCGMFGIAFVGYNYFVQIELWEQIAHYLPSGLNEFYYRLLWLGYTFFAAIMVLIGANYLKEYAHKTHSVLVKMGMLSFGIYLIHPFYLMILRPIFATAEPIGVFHIYQVVIILLAVILSLVTVYVVYRFVPYSRIIFGKSSIPYRVKQQKATKDIVSSS